jgi:hypothetical protein
VDFGAQTSCRYSAELALALRISLTPLGNIHRPKV